MVLLNEAYDRAFADLKGGGGDICTAVNIPVRPPQTSTRFVFDTITNRIKALEAEELPPRRQEQGTELMAWLAGVDGSTIQVIDMRDENNHRTAIASTNIINLTG